VLREKHCRDAVAIKRLLISFDIDAEFTKRTKAPESLLEVRKKRHKKQ